MRGKDYGIVGRAVNYRITPAHAGKSDYTDAIGTMEQDHPRPCGEKRLRARSRASGKGSPPPMRGKVYAYADVRRRIRITPAHAGKRCVNLEVMAIDGDHPRPCGEKLA